MPHHWQGGIIHTGNKVRNNALNYLHIITQRRVSIYLESPPKPLMLLTLVYQKKVPDSFTSHQLLTTLSLQVWLDGLTSKKNFKILWLGLLWTPNVSCFNKEAITYIIFWSESFKLYLFLNISHRTSAYIRKKNFLITKFFKDVSISERVSLLSPVSSAFL